MQIDATIELAALCEALGLTEIRGGEREVVDVDGVAKTFVALGKVEVDDEDAEEVLREQGAVGWWDEDVCAGPEPITLGDWLQAILDGDLATATALSARIFSDERLLAVCDATLRRAARRAA